MSSPFECQYSPTNDVLASASVTDRPSLAWVGITESIRVDFPGRRDILKAIARVHELADVLREPPGLAVLGYTGAGKSAIALEYLARYPRYEDEGQTIVPVLYVVMPDKPTRRSMVAAILKALGDLAFDRGSADALTERLGELLRACRTRLIIIDEFQHVMDRAQKNVAAEAAEWLKTFWYSNRIGVVLCGLDHCYKLFTRKENKQLRRRLSRPLMLKPFPWNEDYGVSYALFLRELDEKQPFPNFGMARPEFAMHMWLATKGHVGRTNSILMGAVRNAVERGASELEIEDFKAGFKTSIHVYAEDRGDDDAPVADAFENLRFAA